MRQLAFLFLFACTGIAQAQSFFKPVQPQGMALSELAGARTWLPSQFSTWELGEAALSTALQSAPMEFTPEAYRSNPSILEVPLPDGSTESYAVFRVMACEQAVYDRFPEIRTFAGYSLKDPTKLIRGSMTVRGFRAMVLGKDRTQLFIEPYVDGQTRYYISYHVNDIPSGVIHFSEERGLAENATIYERRPVVAAPTPTQDRGVGEVVRLKVYRYAASCTAEFGIDHGGTPETAFAAIVEYTNLVSAIFEVDVTMRLQLVAGCEAMAFVNPDTDPFSGFQTAALASTNNLVVNGYIGANNYDVGHVYARSSGGYAGVSLGLGVACVPGNKAGGCTAGQQGIYGPVFVNVLGQELGHQFAGGHTWNRCGGSPALIDQRHGASAFEPGSGSTILSYAGGCGSDNIQFGSDDYFHAGSIKEMRDYYTIFLGGTCGFFTDTDNQLPEVELDYENDFFIPISTPFELTGTGTDPDGDILTFCWEQVNIGPETPLQTPVGSSPLFRTYPPVTSTTRTFPKWSTILNNSFDVREQLPTYDRDLNFRFSARDNRPSNGGVDWKDVEFRATEQAGPFLVLSPNAGGTTWTAGQFVTVQWDVANTQLAPVNCQRVNIRLSTDGGQTWPYYLATGVSNDGEHNIQVPNLATNSARIRVDAADNIFFDVSDNNFVIAQPTQPSFTAGMSENTAAICLPDQFSSTIYTASVLGFNNPANLEIVPGNLPASASVSLSATTLVPGAQSELLVDLNDVTEAGTFQFQLRLTAENADTILFTVTITTYTNDFSSMALQSPLDGSTDLVQSQVLRWAKADDAVSYDVQLASSPSFAPGTILASKTNTALDTFKIPFLLEKNKAYFWRIRPNNICSPHPWTEPFFFSTLTENCSTFTPTDLPKNIPAGNPSTVTSKVELFAPATITDINIKQLKGFHSYFSDLEAKLISPLGTEVLLFKNRCNNYNGVYDFGMDDSAPNAFTCPPNNAGGSFVRPQNPLLPFVGQQAQGQWTLSIRDQVAGSGGTIDALELDICQSVVVNPPYLVNNNILSLAAGTNQQILSDKLLVEDNDNTHNELVYTLVTSPGQGELKVEGQGTIQTGGQFTQADIDNGKLRYYNFGAGNGAADKFRFIVSDGDGGYLGTLVFVIQLLVETENLAGTMDFQLFPNPATDAIWLVLEQYEVQDQLVSVFNSTGQLVQSVQLPKGESRVIVSTATLPRGLYFVQLSSGGRTFSRKVVLR